MVLDMGSLLGDILALGMATLFFQLPKVAAKLFAKGQKPLGLVAVACGIGLLTFIYVGQSEVAWQKANDPLSIIMAEGKQIENHSNIHIVATSLIGLLYGCALLLSYLYYSDKKNNRPLDSELAMSSLGRELQERLLPLRGLFQRASAKPKNMAEARVSEYIQTLEEKERILQDTLIQQENARDYELAALENARKRIKLAIRTAYKY